MPNTFVNLDVPANDGAGTPFVTSALGRPKTLVFSGPVRGRYVVEGSNDGGDNWDIIVDDSGLQALFTSQTPGIRSFDCIVDRLRVRSIGNLGLTPLPQVALGAPPAVGTSVFGRLDVPLSTGFGAPFDLGLGAGAFKTFILRGAIPRGARYSIQGSIDGVRFDEIALFTSDQQGAQPAESLCRFLRVQRDGLGSAPVVAFGSEGIVEPFAPGAASEMAIAEPGQVATSSFSDEEVLRQYHAPLSLLAAPSLLVTLSGESKRGAESGIVTFRVRSGGNPDQPDGTELLAVADSGSGSSVLTADSLAFPRPTDPSTLLKVTAQGSGLAGAAIRNFVLLFHAAVVP